MTYQGYGCWVCDSTWDDAEAAVSCCRKAKDALCAGMMAAQKPAEATDHRDATIPALLEELDRLDARRTPGPWKWWTSNSWRRLRADRDGGRATVSVIEPYVCRDGHPDCNVSEDDMAFIVALENAYPRLRAEIEGLRGEVDSAVDKIEETEAEMAAILDALRAAGGYLRNAKIDLETGATKRTAVRTIEGGLNLVEAAIAKVEVR